MKTIQWRKLWYHFPVVIQRYSRKRAVSFKKVSLPESLPEGMPPVSMKKMPRGTHPHEKWMTSEATGDKDFSWC